MKLANLATLATFPDGRRFILICNQFFYNDDPNQTEALIPPVQAQARTLDGSPGMQQLEIAKARYPLFFDGYKVFLPIRKPTPQDWKDLPVIELTSPLPYDPQKQVRSVRLGKITGPRTPADWRECLGFPPMSVIKMTLKHTT